MRAALRSLHPWLLLLIILVTASRLLVIPGEPLDLTEVEVATAALDQALVEQPWQPQMHLNVLIARIGSLLTGEPILGLQLLTAFASIATVIGLALLWQLVGMKEAEDGKGLGHRVPKSHVAIWAAALYAGNPAVWFHCYRVSSATIQVFIAIAGLLAMCRQGRGGVVLGTLLLGSAILVSPGLAPALLVAFAASLHMRHRSRVENAGALALFLVVVGAGLGWQVLGRGGVSLSGLLDQAPGSDGELGVILAHGGAVWTQVAVLLALVGWWSLYQSRRRLAWWWLVGLVVTTVCLILLPSRGLSAAALPVLALLSGPVAAGIFTLLPYRLWAGLVSGGVCCASIALALPPVWSVAKQGSLPLAALSQAHQLPEVKTVIVDDSLTPYLGLLRAARCDVRPMVTRDQLAEHDTLKRVSGRPWALVTGFEPGNGWIPAPSPLVQESLSYARAESVALLDPTLPSSCRVVREGGIVLASGESDAGADWDLTASGRSVLLQPSTPASSLGAVVAVTDGEAVLELRWGRGRSQRRRLMTGRYNAYISVRSSRRGRPHYRSMIIEGAKLEGDGHASLERIWIDRSSGCRVDSFSPGQQASGLDGLLDEDGFYDAEQLGDPARLGRWTEPSPWLSMPVAGRELVIEMCAPRPQPAQVTLRLTRHRLQQTLIVTAEWQEVVMPVSSRWPREILHIEISNPFVPADEIAGSDDQRQLGVVVGTIRYR
jgi:hypothetical protein